MTDKQEAVPATPAATPKKRKRRNVALWILGPAVVLGIAGYMYLVSGRYVSTDNAYVGADHVTIAPQIGGRVVEVLVRENQAVKAGDVLFRIDAQPLEIATAHSQVNTQMLARYQKGAVVAAAMPLRSGEMSAVERELTEIKSSRSWQITQPLRNAADLLRNLRKG